MVSVWKDTYLQRDGLLQIEIEFNFLLFKFLSICSLVAYHPLHYFAHILGLQLEWDVTDGREGRLRTVLLEKNQGRLIQLGVHICVNHKIILFISHLKCNYVKVDKFADKKFSSIIKNDVDQIY